MNAQGVQDRETTLADFWVDFLNFLSTCLGSRFAMDFWCFFDALQTLKIWFSLKRKHNFVIFVKVVIGIVFDPQNLPKIVQQMVPRGVQEALKRLQRLIQKNMFFFTQIAPYSLARGLPDSPPRARIFE